jgi:hypothetical protein
MRRLLVLCIPACLAVCLLLTEGTASAQSVQKSNWRQRTRDAAAQPFPKFTLEARFGAYYPEVDEEFGAPGPFADYFGTGAQFYFGLELDWTPLRIPYVGRIGPAVGWGITTMNGAAKIGEAAADGTEQPVGPTTSLTIHALHVSVALRIDEIARRTVVPFVPYAKAGFGFGFWSSGTATGTSKVGTDCDEVTPADCTVAEGMSIGPHIALGGMLGLNWLDRRSGVMARENTGIHQVSLFGEWMWANLDSGTGKAPLHIGTSTWVLGLAFDF